MKQALNQTSVSGARAVHTDSAGTHTHTHTTQMLPKGCWVQHVETLRSFSQWGSLSFQTKQTPKDTVKKSANLIGIMQLMVYISLQNKAKIVLKITTKQSLYFNPLILLYFLKY